MFVKPEDFSKGILRLPSTQANDIDLQTVIDRVEPDILQKMLGCALYELFIEDYNTDPENEFSEERFKKIYDKFCQDDDCGIVQSEGIKEMLKYFIYVDYVNNFPVQVVDKGIVRVNAENSENATQQQMGLPLTYNKGVDTYAAIQWFMCENEADYPENNMQPLRPISWL